jgi:hypothetical protein
MVCYCSRECQLKSWKAGHKEACIAQHAFVGKAARRFEERVESENPAAANDVNRCFGLQ